MSNLATKLQKRPTTARQPKQRDRKSTRSDATEPTPVAEQPSFTDVAIGYAAKNAILIVILVGILAIAFMLAGAGTLAAGFISSKTVEKVQQDQARKVQDDASQRAVNILNGWDPDYRPRR